MARPCICDRCDKTPGAGYTQDQCWRCWHFHHDERYRALWSNGQVRTSAKIPLPSPCRHLGEPTGETRPCKACNSTRDVPLRSCAVHGTCTETILLPQVACCRANCPDHAVAEKVVPPAQKIILVNKLSPGDCLVMTAAIESLHRQYPGQYATGVESVCPEVFEHNPHVVNLKGDPDARRIVMEYPGINQSNQRPIHFMTAYCDFLGAQLGIRLDCVVNRPSLYFSEQEGRWMSRVQEIYGRPRKHWILAAGVKQDYVAKGWVQAYWQEVVDRLAGKILFVQIGKAEHLHKPLKGVVDQIGKTNLRELIRLCRSAEGGIGPVTFLGHAMAALSKPYICLAGGREPPAFTAYATQTTLHTIGALPCCKVSSCWKSRVVPLNDGDRKDSELCEFPVPVQNEIVTRCASLIKPEDVVRAVERYHEGGVLAY